MLNLNATIGYGLGWETAKRIEELPEIATVEIPEDETDNLVEFIQSNHQNWSPAAIPAGI